MIDQTGNTLTFDGFFTASGVGATGLSVTVDVWNPANTRIVTGATAAEIGDGLYTYTLPSSGSNTATAGNYRAVFKTSGTADQQHVPALWTIGKSWVQNLDTNVGSVAAAVWGVATRTLTGFGFSVTCSSVTDKTGYSLATSQSFNTTGSVGSVTAGVNLNLAQLLSAPRVLDAVEDNAMTTNDALWGAVSEAAGKETTDEATSYVKKTPAGTTIRNFVLTIDGSGNPTARS